MSRTEALAKAEQQQARQRKGNLMDHRPKHGGHEMKNNKRAKKRFK